MGQTDQLREALRREAERMEMSRTMPVSVSRSIARRRAGVLAAAGLTVAAVAFAAGSLQGVTPPDRSDAAGRSTASPVRAGVTSGGVPTTDPRVIARGSDFGMRWQLVVSRAPAGPCLELQVNGRARTCDVLGEGYGFGFEVFPGYASKEGLAYVFGTIPRGSTGVSISLRGGGQWAGLVFEGAAGDVRDYFVRVFPTPDVAGIVELDGGTRVAFDVSPREKGAVTSVRFTRERALPGFEGLPGETRVLYTMPLLDSAAREPFDVVLRTDSRELCLHIDDSVSCVARDGPDDVRLIVAPRIGAGRVIVGLLSPRIEEVTVASSSGGDRYPQQLMSVEEGGLEHRFFVMEAESPFEGRVLIFMRDGSTATIPLEQE